MKHILRADPSKLDDSWQFSLPPEILNPPRTRPNWGKSIRFTTKEIVFEIAQLPSNRILHDDDPSMFILASFAELRFPDGGPNVTTDYISRLMKAGLFLNNIQYRFYHHSNSQLVSSLR
jgi:regulator of nonsense transcripts 1